MEKELVLWMDGKLLRESEAKISVFDLGFLRGDAVFDAARTFQGKPFQFEEHVDRLLQSCRALELNPGKSRAELLQLAQEVTAANRDLIPVYGDYWIIFNVTRGVRRKGFPERGSLIISCTPLPLAERAPLYRDGIGIVIPSVRRTPPWALSPRIKSHNYLNFVIAELETKGFAPRAWPVLLDENGCLAEGYGSNIFVVKKGELLTPFERYVLPGISRRTVMNLAGELGISVREANLEPHDLYAAEEIFLTSTSLCLCGVSEVNGRKIAGCFPGPMTQKLTRAYVEAAGTDFVEQYLSRLAPSNLSPSEHHEE